MAFRNRIIEYGVKAADQFLAHPDNPKVHPQFQRDVMRGILGEVGFVGAVIESARTGYLLDGHDRIFEALDANNSDVPYLLVDVTEEEEAYILSTFDPVARLAYHDTEQINALLKHVQSDDANVQALLDAMRPPDTGGETEDDTQIPLTRYDVPDAIFASDNDYDIPLLDITLQARTFDLPFAIWNTISAKLKTRMGGGTYCFYTYDRLFDVLWNDPSQIVNSGVANIVEPNFSCYADMPMAVGVYQIYRKRWIARWCQTHGVRVLVDLNVAPKWRALNLMGVPKGWTAYATRGTADYLYALDEEFALACDHADSAALLFVVYGGGKQVQALCKQRGWLWVADVMTTRRQLVKEISNG